MFYISTLATHHISTPYPYSLVMANIKIKLKKKHKAQFRKRRDIARLSDEGISNAYRVPLERHLGQAEPSQDMDENAKKIAMERKEIVAKWQTGNIDRNAIRFEKRPERTKRNGWRDSART